MRDIRREWGHAAAAAQTPTITLGYTASAPGTVPAILTRISSDQGTARVAVLTRQ